MLQDRYLSVHKASTREEFRSEVVRFAQQLGFDTVSAVAVIDRPPDEPEFLAVDNAPEAYRQCIDDAARGRADPVMQHCKYNSVPIIWDQDTYVRRGQGPLWESQALHGYRTGVCLALHLPEGRHFLFGVDRDQAMPRDPATVTRMVADVQLFAVHAQDAAQRIMLPPSAQHEPPSLTPRMLEALRWTMAGRTAWEVGKEMGISERTAVWHIARAMEKLGCNSKHQAVWKAVRLGLIR